MSRGTRGTTLGSARAVRAHTSRTCSAVRLAVELDGAAHDGPERAETDADRTRHLAVVGIRVIRFENRAVFEQPDAVLDTIRDAAREAPGDEPGRDEDAG